MEAASTLLNSIALTPSDDIRGSSVEDNFPVHYLSHGELSAFRYFFTQFSYCYVLTIISIGLTPALRLSIERTRAIFYGKDLFKNMLGGYDDVMITMLDIAVLRDWKESTVKMDAANQKTLDVQANSLHSRLRQLSQSLAIAEDASLLGREADQAMITRCFISASFVYLAAITSAFEPDLPEIKIGVLQTLADLEHMRASSSINIPSWPYCVAGCLAHDKDFPRIHALNPRPQAGTHPLVMTKWTLDIIEECWRVRGRAKPDAMSCDWRTGMNNLGTRLMLG